MRNGAILFILAACARAPEQDRPDAPIVLSADSPSEVQLPEGPATWERLSIPVERIDNPAREAVVVKVSLRAHGKSVELGRFSPFPPDQAGLFHLSVPPAARALLEASKGAGAPSLQVELEPVTPDRPLGAGLRVVIGPPRWQ